MLAVLWHHAKKTLPGACCVDSSSLSSVGCERRAGGTVCNQCSANYAVLEAEYKYECSELKEMEADGVYHGECSEAPEDACRRLQKQLSNNQIQRQ